MCFVISEISSGWKIDTKISIITNNFYLVTISYKNKYQYPINI